ncbi:MAG: inosine/xanthosine triphosphatase [Candidatus Uhrbacteria bacterium]|nr:inosine/xanthosine triphosphatase [Candidatus Uhrbacteria bacterium]
MRIHVGSSNANKVGAVEDVLKTYPQFAEAEIVGVEVSSGVGEQPMSLAETVRGATNRAKACFDGADFSIGIEGGHMEVPDAGPMNLQVCAIYDGKRVHHGLSSAFGLPENVVQLMQGGATLDDAVHKAGLTDNPALGRHSGIIGVFTGGRVDRRGLAAQAVQMAIIHLDAYGRTAGA